jgi:hypothetical protein
MLQDNFKYYVKHQDELVKLYSGKYLVISNNAVLYASQDKDEARKKGLDMAGRGNFILQKCTPGTEDYTMTFHTHRVCFNQVAYV